MNTENFMERLEEKMINRYELRSGQKINLEHARKNYFQRKKVEDLKRLEANEKERRSPQRFDSFGPRTKNPRLDQNKAEDVFQSSKYVGGIEVVTLE